jgi:hypothetical protein
MYFPKKIKYKSLQKELFEPLESKQLRRVIIFDRYDS